MKSLKNKSNEQLAELLMAVQAELDSRLPVDYHEITLYANQYKGTGKCWIQRIEDKKRTFFITPYNMDRDGYTIEKIFRLIPGDYLINTSGSKSRDDRYKLRVLPDFSVEKF